jgi:hypothetical protein
VLDSAAMTEDGIATAVLLAIAWVIAFGAGHLAAQQERRLTVPVFVATSIFVALAASAVTIATGTAYTIGVIGLVIAGVTGAWRGNAERRRELARRNRVASSIPASPTR